MATFEVQDPYKGKPYSQILEGLTGDKRKAYTDTIPPLKRVAGTGKAEWCTTIGRYVV